MLPTATAASPRVRALARWRHYMRTHTWHVMTWCDALVMVGVPFDFAATCGACGGAAPSSTFRPGASDAAAPTSPYPAARSLEWSPMALPAITPSTGGALALTFARYSAPFLAFPARCGLPHPARGCAPVIAVPIMTAHALVPPCPRPLPSCCRLCGKSVALLDGALLEAAFFTGICVCSGVPRAARDRGFRANDVWNNAEWKEQLRAILKDVHVHSKPPSATPSQSPESVRVPRRCRACRPR